MREEILPCAVAEPKGELYRLRCNADVHRSLNRTDAVRHIGDDLPFLLDVLTLQREHDKNDALPRILEHILRKICLDLHGIPPISCTSKSRSYGTALLHARQESTVLHLELANQLIQLGSVALEMLSRCGKGIERGGFLLDCGRRIRCMSRDLM